MKKTARLEGLLHPGLFCLTEILLLRCHCLAPKQYKRMKEGKTMPFLETVYRLINKYNQCMKTPRRYGTEELLYPAETH